MKKLFSRIYKTEDENEVEVKVSINGCDCDRESVVTYIDTELVKTLKEYLKSEETLNEVIGKTEELFGLLVSVDANEVVYFDIKDRFYEITCTKRRQSYDVDVTLTKKKK